MTAPSAKAPGRPGGMLLALGLVLAALGVIGYAAQLWANRLAAPWYMPILGTLGLVCLASALWQARSVWRVLALLLVLLLCGAEWAFLLKTRQPDYTGPLA